MEMLYYLGAKALICNDKGEVLTLHITNGEKSYWDFPGGRINRSEDIEKALKREVQEETGITDVVIGECLGTELTSVQIPVPGDHPRGLILTVYTCTAPVLSEIVTEPNMRAEWCTPQEAIARNSKFSESMRQRILAALQPAG